MKSREKIFSKVLEKEIDLSPEDVDRLDHAIDAFEETFRRIYTKIWYEREYTDFSEELKNSGVDYVENYVIPQYEESSPKVASALKSVMAIEPDFFPNGDLSEVTWKIICRDYSDEVVNEVERRVKALSRTYNGLSDEYREDYVNKAIEDCLDHYAELVIDAALGHNSHGYNVQEE